MSLAAADLQGSTGQERAGCPLYPTAPLGACLTVVGMSKPCRPTGVFAWHRSSRNG